MPFAPSSYLLLVVRPASLLFSWDFILFQRTIELHRQPAFLLALNMAGLGAFLNWQTALAVPARDDPDAHPFPAATRPRNTVHTHWMLATCSLGIGCTFWKVGNLSQ